MPHRKGMEMIDTLRVVSEGERTSYPISDVKYTRYWQDGQVVKVERTALSQTKDFNKGWYREKNGTFSEVNGSHTEKKVVELEKDIEMLFDAGKGIRDVFSKCQFNHWATTLTEMRML